MLLCNDLEVLRWTDWLKSKGAGLIAHSGRTLLIHLTGTMRLLQHAGYPREVCAAGLFHSVYGTSSFGKAIISSECRDDVRNEIGEAAENLVWIFSSIDKRLLTSATFEQFRPEALLRLQAGQETCNAERTLQDITAIEIANLLEQKLLGQVPRLCDVAVSCGFITATGFLKSNNH